MRLRGLRVRQEGYSGCEVVEMGAIAVIYAVSVLMMVAGAIMAYRKVEI